MLTNCRAALEGLTVSLQGQLDNPVCSCIYIFKCVGVCACVSAFACLCVCTCKSVQMDWVLTHCFSATSLHYLKKTNTERFILTSSRCVCVWLCICVCVCQWASVSERGSWHLPVPVEQQQLSPTARLRDLSWLTVTSWSLESSPQSTGFTHYLPSTPSSTSASHSFQWAELILACGQAIWFACFLIERAWSNTMCKRCNFMVRLATLLSELRLGLIVVLKSRRWFFSLPTGE